MKLELHTHVFEEFLPSSPGAITLSMVENIVEQVKSADLDGIGVTEHGSKAYGYRVHEIVEEHFASEILIIPGQEFERDAIHYVELDVPGKDILPFRFIAHPGYPGNPASQAGGFNGIEIENAAHNWHIKGEEVKKLAAKHNLLLLSNSDAHYLRDIGRRYTEISLTDLCRTGPARD